VPTELDEDLCGESKPVHRPGLDFLGDLTADARELAMLLLESPAELAEEVTPRRHLVRVRKYLQEWGRTKEQLDEAQAELMTVLQGRWA
jgi:hypothetical protein